MWSVYPVDCTVLAVLDWHGVVWKVRSAYPSLLSLCVIVGQVELQSSVRLVLIVGCGLVFNRDK
jgi:hypothetical protein